MGTDKEIRYMSDSPIQILEKELKVNNDFIEYAKGLKEPETEKQFGSIILKAETRSLQFERAIRLLSENKFFPNQPGKD